jgi:DnaK suppressor protein
MTAHRDTLLALRARLTGDMGQMADAALSKPTSAASIPSDLADVGTDAYEQALTLSLLGNGKDVLEQIDAALERTEDGSYGRCEECGKVIPAARLEAIPYAALCVKCASREEKGHR